MNEGYDLEEFQVAVADAMKQGYIVHYECAEGGGAAVRLITRPNHIRQEVARFCEVFKQAVLEHVEQAVTGVDGKPGDPIFERKQMALNVEGIVKNAMLTGFAAADAASRDGYESVNTFDGLYTDGNGEQGEDVVEK